MAGDRIQETGNQIIAIIPRITEQERNQAQLVDSDSDAEYDEENVQDNQVGNVLLDTSDDDDDDGDHMGVVVAQQKKPAPTHQDAAPITDSTSRVEAAFAAAFQPAQPTSDSLARVEMAFAEAFGVVTEAAGAGTTTSATAVSASASLQPPQGSGQPSNAFPEAFSEPKAVLGAPAVPLLAPPTRSPALRKGSTAASPTVSMGSTTTAERQGTAAAAVADVAADMSVQGPSAPGTVEEVAQSSTAAATGDHVSASAATSAAAASASPKSASHEPAAAEPTSARAAHDATPVDIGQKAAALQQGARDS